MKRLLFIKTLSILGVVVSLGGIMAGDSFTEKSSLSTPSFTNLDKVILHMKEVTEGITLTQKKKSTENYVLAIGGLIGTDKKGFSPEQEKIIERFAMRYLNAEFKSESALVSSFQSMISSVMDASGLPLCDGDWVGSGGYLNNCDDGTEIIFAGIPTGACVYECLDPYIVVDCVLYAPCIPS